ncbi:MAG TPA: hypothetical protein VNJ28_05790, partial [Candidatus Limnocylindrales bacterium]|nr:hypothetical protein [Candidatus Limnocylindrales bacterium]
RRIPASDVGLTRPIGLAYLPAARALLVLEGASSGRIVSVDEDDLGAVELGAALPDPTLVAFDARGARLLAADSTTGELLELGTDRIGRPTSAGRRLPAAALEVGRITGLAVDAAGRLHVLDGARGRVLRVTPGSDGSLDLEAAASQGRVQTIALAGPARGDLRGLSVSPVDGHLFVFSPSGRTLDEFTSDGRLVATRSLAGVAIADPVGFVVAPTADSTDDPSLVGLYVVDAGRPGGGAGSGPALVELATTETVVQSVGSQFTVAQLVNVIDTSRWSPPSPDPSGLAYRADIGRLVVTDGEVEEMSIYQGRNGWLATTSGTVTDTFVTLGFTREPVGVAFDPGSGHYFVSADTDKKVYEVDPGSDGLVGLGGDDTLVASFSTSTNGAGDPEGLAFIPSNGTEPATLAIADGVDKEIYLVRQGADGSWAAPNVWSSFDVARYGQTDPESVEFDATAGTLYTTSNEDEEPLLTEVRLDGTEVRTVSLAGNGLDSAGGLTLAPPSGGGSGTNVYIADRGIDNADDPNENDGKIYEFALVQGEIDNVLANPGFELDANGDGRPDGWTSKPAFTRSSDVVHGGSFAGRHQSNANAGYTVQQVVKNLSGGTIYGIAGWVNIPPTSDAFKFIVRISWRNGSTVLRVDDAATYTQSTSGWVQFVAGFTAPPGTTNAQIRMTVKSLNATIYVDDFEFGP